MVGAWLGGARVRPGCQGLLRRKPLYKHECNFERIKSIEETSDLIILGRRLIDQEQSVRGKPVSQEPSVHSIST